MQPVKWHIGKQSGINSGKAPWDHPQAGQRGAEAGFMKHAATQRALEWWKNIRAQKATVTSANHEWPSWI